MHPLRKQRIYALTAILLGIILSTILVIQGLSKNINLFYTPSEILQIPIEESSLIRAGGMVKKGTLKREKDSLLVSFEITDFKESLVVIYEGILPDLFSEDAGVVVQGNLNKDKEFVAVEVLAKHDENYMPPEVAKALKESDDS